MNTFSDLWIILLLAAAGLIAGFIDSVAGGGGLISVPLLSLLIGPGALAIGTNKVAAVCSSAFALVVYLRGGHVAFKRSIGFALLAGLGAGFGALLAPMIPASAYRWILILVCPMILWIVVRKDIWVHQELQETAHTSNSRSETLLAAAGFICGLYDGVAGPGGGTLMFLSLFLLARTPLLTAIATAKLANLSSASVSLVTFAATGHVIWGQGLWLAIGISLGAFVGASYATRNAAPIARSFLLIIAIILLVRLAFS